MSNLSPQCATKRTSVNAMNLLVHALVQLEVRRPGPRLLAQPSSILVPPDGRAALNIRIKPNNISREQPGQQAEVSLKRGRGGWGATGLHKGVSVVRTFGRSARKVGETAAAGPGSAGISPLRPRGRNHQRSKRKAAY